MLAKFKGTNNSMGFKRGQVYDLSIVMQERGWQVVDKNAKFTDRWCPYTSARALLNNWGFQSKQFEQKLEATDELFKQLEWIQAL